MVKVNYAQFYSHFVETSWAILPHKIVSKSDQWFSIELSSD